MNTSGVFLAGSIVGFQVGLIVATKDTGVAWIMAAVIAIEALGVTWVWRHRE